MLPDRASPDRSREAGLNDMTSQCTGVPAMKIISNTSMASGFGVTVKGSHAVGSGPAHSQGVRMARFGTPSSASEKDRNSKSN